MSYFITFLVSFLGGFTQAITGFGAGVVILMGLPYFLPLVEASGCSSAICIGGQLTSLYLHRKHFDIRRFLKIALLPIVLYLCVSIPTIFYVKNFNVRLLKLSFGVFLILLAIYYIFLSKKAKVGDSPLAGAACAAFSGFCAGAFGVGGPPMALYFLGATKGDKYFYIIVTQFMFLISSVVNTGVRAYNGILRGNHIPYILIGLFAMALGTKVASLVIDKINAKMFRYIIYFFVAFSGIVTVIQCI